MPWRHTVRALPQLEWESDRRNREYWDRLMSESREQRCPATGPQRTNNGQPGEGVHSRGGDNRDGVGPQQPVAVGEQKMEFGKHRGKSFFVVFNQDPGYVNWALQQTTPSGPLAAFVAYCRNCRSGNTEPPPQAEPPRQVEPPRHVSLFQPHYDEHDEPTSAVPAEPDAPPTQPPSKVRRASLNLQIAEAAAMPPPAAHPVAAAPPGRFYFDLSDHD
eukprot:Hpha_TRINITY_DN9141_c0_g1::TRINITY_DN9141_c0_g1_i1::g.94388::m.94388